MRRLTVLSVAYPLAPTGPDAVGGSEQVLTALDRALVAQGHNSIVLAMEGSQAAGELVTYSRHGPDEPITEAVCTAQRRKVDRAIRRILQQRPIDLIHMHGLDFHFYLPPPGVPVLATLHLPPDWYPVRVWECDRPNTWLNCVSQDQVDHTWPSHRMQPPIPNGVPVDRLGAIRPRKQRYALMLSRVCPEKGLHLALQAAHASNTSLLIGGEIFPYQAHQDYFTNEVAPLLDRHRRYLGPLGFPRKRRLLAAARCVLIPSLVPETSSLVAMEAASCGTPVIAFPNGALPEVVEHGRTGFIVEDAKGMAEAISRIGEIDPEICRQVARDRFSLDRMTSTYIARYQELAGQLVTAAA
jgi:glycosyltransferase involved in cell wall biosynthesis